MRVLAYLVVGLANIVAFAAVHQLGGVKSPIIIFLSLLPLNLVVTLVHELGHAWMAKRRGAQVERIAVLPFQYDAAARKFGFASRNPDSEIGGYILYAFEDFDEMRRDAALIAGAGPAVNLLLAIVILLLVLAWPAPPGPFAASGAAPVEVVVAIPDDRVAIRPMPQVPPDDTTRARVFAEHDAYRVSEARYLVGRGLAIALALLSLGAALANLVPFRGSDGYVLRDALFRR